MASSTRPTKKIMKISLQGNKIFGYRPPKNFNSHFIFIGYKLNSFWHRVHSIVNSQLYCDESIPDKRVEEECYCLIFHGDNIGHFFHDIFFPFYARYRKKPRPIYFSFANNKFFYDFLCAAAGVENLIELSPLQTYHFDNVFITPEGRDLKDYDNYLEICNEIKNTCFKNLGIKENRYRTVLYGRTELARKKLLYIDHHFLKQHGIEMFHFSEMSFLETVKVMAETKNFIYIVGASVFYLLFLSKEAFVLEINPAVNNSWANMFGMDQLCQFRVMITQNIKATSTAEYANILHDSDVVFDADLKTHISNLLLDSKVRPYSQ